MEQERGHTRGTRFSARLLRTPRHILGAAIKKIWQLLILRDNWQGELSIALFGAVGWSLDSILLGAPLTEIAAYSVLTNIFPQVFWEVLLLVSGFVQLIGLRLDRPYWRTVGATGVFFGFSCLFLAVMQSDPGTRALGLYLAAMCVEFCAIVYQTARIVRSGGLSRWPWTIKQ